MKQKLKNWEKKYKIEKIEKIENKYLFILCLIIYYKFGAYIKIFRYTFLTTWHYLWLAAIIDKVITCDKVSEKLAKKFQRNWAKTAKLYDILTVSYKKYCL